MQFIDLMAQQRRIRQDVMERITKVLDHGQYINGPEVRELESKLAEFVELPFAIGCSSGTDALLMPLMAMSVGPGDAVFAPTFTFIATAEVIQLLGATPVFVDIDSASFNMDPQKLDEAVSSIKKEGNLRPRGILVVDLFGLPADYEAIGAIAKEHELFVFEDAAQSFGASYRGAKACSLSEISATSFFPAKPLGCYGDGGMIFTRDEKIYEVLLSIRDHGKGKDKYDNVRIGTNGRLDTIQAAILLAKFSVFEKEIELRQKVSHRYTEGLHDVCQVPHVDKGKRSAWAQYSIVHPRRDMIAEHLKNEGIPTAIYYPKPLHLQQAFASLGHHEGDFPVSEEISKKIISLPMHPYMEVADQERIIHAVRESIS